MKSEHRIVSGFVAAFLAVSFYAVVFGAPPSPPKETTLIVPAGATITETATLLNEAGALRWSAVFSVLVRLGAGTVVAGPYALPGKEDAITLAYRFSHGVREVNEIKVTIPEGASVKQAGDILKKDLGTFDEEKFISLGTPDEGYLFPDTYFFLPGTTPEEVIQAMKSTFTEKIAPLQSDIAAFGKSESDVIVMASLLEKEARQPETRRTIAGILWKRLSLGMPLQVDATFGYIFGTSTYSPSAADLKMDSPYNTYLHAGLPPGPIGNPGTETVEDAVTPISTPYLYYVTDKEGDIFYAKTIAEHVQNIQKAAKIDKEAGG